MCGGKDPEAPQAAPPAAPPPVPTADVQLTGVKKKAQAQNLAIARRGKSAARRDLQINMPTASAGLNTGGAA